MTAAANALVAPPVASPYWLTVDRVVDHLVAPIVYRVIFLPWTLDDSTARKLVADLFALRAAASAL
jgi:hypothetical protein